MLELSVNNKKELQIRDTPLSKSSKMLKISNGIPKDFDIRTFKKHLSIIDLEELREFYDFIQKVD